VVKKVIAGGPAAFCCEVGVDDILLKVDGVDVTRETPDEVAKRIVGPEGETINITTRYRKIVRAGRPEFVEHTSVLLRQPIVHLPERLAEQNQGLGIDLVRTEHGHLRIRSLQNGGAASLSGKLLVGDTVIAIDGIDVTTLGDGGGVSRLLVGEPFSRVCLMVDSAGQRKEVHMVRSVVLMGEYEMKQRSYANLLRHAPRAPAPPQQHQQHVREQRSRPLPPSPYQPGAGGAGGGRAMGNAGMQQEELTGADSVVRMLENPQLALGGLGSPALSQWPGSVASSMHSDGSAESGSWTAPSRSISLHDSLTADSSLLSRSSTASRDSIAPVVRQQLGELVDAIRTVEGRENTFSHGWPHQQNPRLSKGKMATAGFIFTPCDECGDKVMCAYCGVELGQWAGADDPWSAHHDATPGCSFWRKSSLSCDRMSSKMFSGYGSPIHSMYLTATAGLEKMAV